MIIRILYEKNYGTTIGPRDEIHYIWICLRETMKILISHYWKKISPGIN